MKTIKLPHSINQSLNEFSVFSCSKYNNLKIGNDNLGRNKLIVSDIWSFWDYIIKRFAEKNHKKEEDKNILFSFLEQARHFYISGESSPVKSQALLYYYSFLNLSKITYLINKNFNNLSSKKYTHGISEVYKKIFKDCEISIKTSDAGDIQIAHEMLILFDSNIAPQPNTNKHNFNIREILSHCTGIHISYSEIYNKAESFIKVVDYSLFKRGKDLYFVGYLDNPKPISDKIPMLRAAGYSIDEFKNDRFTLNENNLVFDELDFFKDGFYFFDKIRMPHGYSHDKIPKIYYEGLSNKIRGRGVWYLVGNNGYTLYLSTSNNLRYRYSQESIIYIVMFFLGSITRYNPYLFDTLFSDKEQWLISEFLMTQPKQFLYLLTSHVLGQPVFKAHVNF